MHVTQRAEQVQPEVAHLRRGQGSVAQPLAEIRALHELHHEEDLWPARVGEVDTGVEQGDETRVVQGAEETRLALLRPQVVGAHGRRREQLDGDVAPEQGVVRAEDGRGAASADDLADAVAALQQWGRSDGRKRVTHQPPPTLLDSGPETISDLEP